MSHLRIVGGTEHGDQEAPAVWDDATEGAARVLRDAMNNIGSFSGVIIVGAYKDRNELYIASNMLTAELTAGFMERAKASIINFAIMSPDIEEYEDDGA